MNMYSFSRNYLYLDEMQKGGIKIRQSRIYGLVFHFYDSITLGNEQFGFPLFLVGE